MTSIRIILLFLLIPSAMYGQKLQSGFVNYRELTVENGLPSNYITCFSKDTHGFMWIGTTKGLVRYDGSRVEVFQHNPEDSLSISGDFINSIQMDGDSLMWVGTAAKGLNKYRFDNQSFTRYFPRANDRTALPAEEVTALVQDRDGVLWIGFHRGGLAKYVRETDSFESVTLPTYDHSHDARQNTIVQKIWVDRTDADVIWLNALQVLIRYNKADGSFETYSYEKEHPNEDRIKGAYEHGIQAANGKIYIPAARKGILVFDPASKTWENYNEPVYDKRNYAENSYAYIQQRDETTFWLGSRTRGIAILDIEKGFILPVDSCVSNKPHQVCKLYVTAMDMDTENGHWVGTNSGMRLYTHFGNQFGNVKFIATKEILKGRTTVVALYPDGETGFYFGGNAGEGLYHYDLASAQTEVYKPPKAYQAGVVHEMFYVRSILPFDASTLLIMSDNAFFKFHTKTKRLELVETGLTHNKDYYYLHRMMAHADGSFYISTRHNGFYILDENLRKKAHFMHDKNDPNSLVWSHYLYEITDDPDGKVWIGTENGFSVFEPETHQFSNFDYLLRMDSVSKLKALYSIKQAPDSSLWFLDSRSHGVYLDYPYKAPYEFKPIVTGQNGLKEQLKGIYFTRNGKTILTTFGGISVIDATGNIRRYTESHGLPALSTLGPVAEMPDGQILIGASSNIVLFYPDSLVDIPINIPIYLSSISIFDDVRDDNLNEVMKEGLELSYRENFFSIHVGMINFDNPEDYVLSYRLAGLSDEWIKDNERKAVFTNVPGGNYTFEGRLQNKDDLTFMGNLSFPVRVTPPFWKQLWFRALIITLVLLIAIAFYMMHIQRIRKEAALKTEFNKRLANMELNTLRAQMNPHFLFNSLNSIRNQIMTNNPVEADKYLVKFSRLVRLVLNNSRQQLITLTDELDALRLYVDLESSRFEHHFTYNIHVADDVDTEKVNIPPLVIQPFVENAIWHGLMQKHEPGTVSLEISRSENTLHIIIEDDGIGREKAAALKSKTAQKGPSMGLEITGNRMRIIEQLYGIACSTEINDLKNTDGSPAGTRIVLTLPLLYEPEDRDNR